MANQQHVDLLMQGIEAWNQWREQNRDLQLDLQGADLRGVNLGSDLHVSELIWDPKMCIFKATPRRVDLRGANLNGAKLNKANLQGADLSGAIFEEAILREAMLSEANLRGTNFREANLCGAKLNKADFQQANLSKADLRKAELGGANFSEANLCEADLGEVTSSDPDPVYFYVADLSRARLDDASLRNLRKADLRGADLHSASLVKTNLTEADLTGCSIYGISAWNVQLEGAIQSSLIITDDKETTITVDNLKVAQFIYLLLNNAEIREVIDTIAKKVVLILGRFTSERKAVLDAIRDMLRTHGYLPILFDFEKPSSRNFTETVRTLAHLARFIIADLTDPSSIPQELQAIIPTLAVPVQPVLLEGKREYSMFVDFLKTYHWVLPVHYYTNQTNLLRT